MARRAVYAALDSERNYQERRWGYRQAGGLMLEPEHCICDFLLYMQDYLAQAIHAAATTPGYDKTLDILRKVITLGIACSEQHGIPIRPDGPVTNGRDGKPA